MFKWSFNVGKLWLWCLKTQQNNNENMLHVFRDSWRLVGMETNWWQLLISGMLLYVVRRSYGYFCLSPSPSVCLFPSRLTFRSENVKSPYFPALCPPPSLVIPVITSVLSRSVSQSFLRINHPWPVLHPPPFPIETLTPIILSPLFVLAWDRWPLSQLIWPCLCCKRGSGCGCYALLTAIFYPSFTLSDDDERAVLEDYQTKMSVTTLHNNRSSNKSLTVFTIFHVI